MALLIPPGNVQYALVIKHDSDNEPMFVTCGHDVTGSLGVPTADLLAIATAWFPFLDNLPTSAVFTEIQGRYGTSNPAEMVGLTVPIGRRGANGNPQLPQNSALLVRKITNRGGRRGRGRMFFPYLLAEGNVNEVGDFATVPRNTLQAVLDQVLTDLQAIGAGPVLLHESTGVTAPGSPDPIVSLVVDGRIATQRRRLRR